MRKKFLFGVLPLFLLFSCAKEDSRVGYYYPSASTSAEKTMDDLMKGALVDLTLDNWETYITVYYVRDNSDAAYGTVVYTWNFVGSSLCKFYNVELTYKNSTSSESTSTKMLKLSISGCGQIVNHGRFTDYYGGTTAITGKVEVLF